MVGGGAEARGGGGWSRRALLARGMHLAAGPAVLGFVGCGSDTAQAPSPSAEGRSLRRVRLQHAWIKDAALGGIFNAMERGLYRDAGIQVEILVGGAGVDPVVPVISGDADLGVYGNSTSVLLAAARGIPLQVIATQYKKSPIGLMAKRTSGIAAIRDIRGKRIGVNQVSVGVLEAVLKLNGLTTQDVKLMVISSPNVLPVLLEDAVDALVAFDTQQGVELQLRGVPFSFIRFDDVGYPQEAYPFFVTPQRLERDHQLLVDFFAATRQGWEEALAHPEAAAELTVRKHAEAADHAHQTAMAKLQATLMRSATTERHGLFYMDADTWHTTNRLMAESGLLAKPVDLNRLLTWRVVRGK